MLVYAHTAEFPTNNNNNKIKIKMKSEGWGWGGWGWGALKLQLITKIQRHNGTLKTSLDGKSECV
jgi:hypothetical protein